MKPARLLSLTVIALTGLLSPAQAQVIVSLGAASSFGVLGGTTVTNTGSTTVTGDLGVSPGSTYTGFPPGLVIGGTIHLADATANQAHADAVAAFDVLAAETLTANLTGQDLGSRTLTSGVYFFSSSAELNGVLTLDGLGDSNARFHFQTGSTLLAAANSQLLLTNGAQAQNVYWKIGSSATFLTSAELAGTFLAAASITAGTGATIDGRLLALNGAVTLDTNSITVPSAVPEPAATAVLIAGLIGVVAVSRRQKRAESVPMVA